MSPSHPRGTATRPERTIRLECYTIGVYVAFMARIPHDDAEPPTREQVLALLQRQGLSAKDARRALMPTPRRSQITGRAPARLFTYEEVARALHCGAQNVRRLYAKGGALHGKGLDGFLERYLRTVYHLPHFDLQDPGGVHGAHGYFCITCGVEVAKHKKWPKWFKPPGLPDLGEASSENMELTADDRCWLRAALLFMRKKDTLPKGVNHARMERILRKLES